MIKNAILNFIYALKIHRLFIDDDRVIVLLLHKLSYKNETKSETEKRLYKWFRWLKRNNKILSFQEFNYYVENKIKFPKNSVLLTIDDAYKEVYDFRYIFQDLDLPVLLFACIGWAENNNSLEYFSLERIIEILHHFEDKEIELVIRSERYKLNQFTKDNLIDLLISNDFEMKELNKIWNQLIDKSQIKISSNYCNWQQLIVLKNQGFHIGSHSATHVNFSKISKKRLVFEIEKSQKIFAHKNLHVDNFAYPYGTKDVITEDSQELIKNSNYKYSFSTEVNQFDIHNNSLQIPRVTIPDNRMSFISFKARVNGAQFPIQKILKTFK